MWDYIQLWFSSVWSLFGMNFPGFSFSIGSVLIGALSATLGLRILGKAVGASFELGSVTRSNWRFDKVGNNRKIKISENRKGDTH